MMRQTCRFIRELVAVLTQPTRNYECTTHRIDTSESLSSLIAEKLRNTMGFTRDQPPNDAIRHIETPRLVRNCRLFLLCTTRYLTDPGIHRNKRCVRLENACKTAPIFAVLGYGHCKVRLVQVVPIGSDYRYNVHQKPPNSWLYTTSSDVQVLTV